MKISPSQIDTFRDCARKWAWDKLNGIRSPPNKSAQLGTAVHSCLEAWLSQGIAPDESTREGAIATRAIAHLPAPMEGHTETRFVLPVHDNLSMTGFIDLLYTLDDGTPIVHDHKTTSNLSYRKKSEDLATDPQAIIYSMYLLDRFPEYNALETHWLYIETKESGAKVTTTKRKWTRDEVQEAFDALIPEADNLVALRSSGLKALDLEPNVNACEKYGGCFYRDHCNLTNEEKLRAMLKIGALQEKVANGHTLASEEVAAPPAKPNILTRLQSRVAPAAPAVVQRNEVVRINSPEEDVEPAAEPDLDAFGGDDEEALAEAIVEQAAPTPAKRGRGRPPKAKPEASPSATSRGTVPAPIVASADQVAEALEKMRKAYEGHEHVAAPSPVPVEPAVRSPASVVSRVEGLRLGAVEQVERLIAEKKSQASMGFWETLSLSELETMFAHRSAIAVRIDELRLLIKAAL